ncbi:transcription antitermination factor NusB [Alphaproteobacteria bacterium]|nr:transcription antitermination factor NusB [Alphaproteobacteria bacterium]
MKTPFKLSDVDNTNKIRRSRTAARLNAVQAVYQMDMTGISPETVVDEFINYRLPVIDENSSLGLPDKELFCDLALGTAKDLEIIDRLITDVLMDGWSSERLESTLHAILRVGSYELKNRSSTPLPVIISEYVDVTHAFYDGKAIGLVNGVLDAISLRDY